MSSARDSAFSSSENLSVEDSDQLEFAFAEMAIDRRLSEPKEVEERKTMAEERKMVAEMEEKRRKMAKEMEEERRKMAKEMEEERRKERRKMAKEMEEERRKMAKEMEEKRRKMAKELKEEEERRKMRGEKKTVKKEDPLEIIFHPEAASLPYPWFSRIELRCQSNKRDATYRWFINEREEPSLRGSSICVPLTNMGYVGKYHCVVEYNGKGRTSKPTNVQVIIKEEASASIINTDQVEHDSYVNRLISPDAFAPLFVREFAEFHHTEKKCVPLARRLLENDFSTGSENSMQEVLEEAFSKGMPQFEVKRQNVADIRVMDGVREVLVVRGAKADLVFESQTGKLVGTSVFKARPIEGDLSLQAVRHFDIRGRKGTGPGIPLPCFLPIFCGDHFQIFGATFVSNIPAPPDPDAVPVHHPDVRIAYERLDSMVLSLLRIDGLASMLGKLENGMEKLAARAESPVSPFPWIEEYGDVRFEYVRQLKGMVFKAKEESGEFVVVKFVRGEYGEEAHRHFWEKGFAPKLKHSERAAVFAENVVFQVVMDIVPGIPLHYILEDAAQGKQPSVDVSVMRRGLEELLDVIRDSPFVHGDLRPVNIMVDSRGKLSVVDFDWARKEGEGFYSPRVNAEAKWFVNAGRHVQKNALIKKEHDIAMLKAILDALPS